MADINRVPNNYSMHQHHLHNCPNCERNYSCNCHTQPDKRVLVCRDCEHGNYDPMIHGGRGEKSEA